MNSRSDKVIHLVAYDMGEGGSESNCANSWISNLQNMGYTLYVYTRSSSQTDMPVIRISDNYLFFSHVNSTLRFYLTFFMWKIRLRSALDICEGDLVWWLTPMGVKNLPSWLFGFENVIVGPIGGAAFVPLRDNVLGYQFKAYLYNLFVRIWRFRLNFLMKRRGKRVKFLASDKGSLEYFVSKGWDSIWTLDVWPENITLKSVNTSPNELIVFVPTRNNWRKGKYNMDILKNLRHIDIYTFLHSKQVNVITIKNMNREDYYEFLKKFDIMILFSEKDGFTSTFAEGLECGLLPICYDHGTGYAFFLERHNKNLIFNNLNDNNVLNIIEKYDENMKKLIVGIEKEKVLLDNFLVSS